MTENKVTKHPIVVNGRFLGTPLTGVERYARELLSALRDDVGRPFVVAAPPGRIEPPRVIDRPSEASSKWTGAKGHAWEQLRLPALFRRTDGRVLLSPCNWGPLRVDEQLIVLHDVAPFVARSSFSGAYGAWARTFAKAVGRRRQTLATVSEFSRRALIAQLDVDPGRVVVVPPGVGAPFDVAAPNVEGPGELGLFVGGHIARKNLPFAIRAWEPIWRKHDLPLHVVVRSAASGALRVRDANRRNPALVFHEDVDDDRLCELYRRAVCVLSPSHHEGFGLPLLEGMALGTPFLSSATGAAEELAVLPDQVLPLQEDLWTARIEELLDSEPRGLRESSVEVARRYTWAGSATALAAAIDARWG